MAIKKVDTQIYMAWKIKRFSYKKIERHFDIIIENLYTILDNQVYTVSFNSKDNTIEDILNAFKEDTPFRFSKVNHNKKT